jgi:uncharacterized Zn-binding protein involved in type VI secretion
VKTVSAAARAGDPTNHPGVISGPGVLNVLIQGKPAAVAMDPHACAFPTGHPSTTMAGGSGSVLIAGRPAIRVGDSALCGAQVTFGATNVDIGG